MPLNAGDVVRIAARLRGPQGQDIINVYHYRATNTISDTDGDILNSIANKMDNIYEPVESEFPATSEPVDLKVDVVEMQNGKEVIVRNLGTQMWGVLFVPSGVGNVYAPGVAVGILLRTAVGKVFARKFIGPLMEATFGDHGHLDSTKIAAFLTMAVRMLDTIPLTGGQLEPGVLSKRLAGFAKFTFSELAAEAFYQRRRSIRMGS